MDKVIEESKTLEVDAIPPNESMVVSEMQMEGGGKGAHLRESAESQPDAKIIEEDEIEDIFYVDESGN